MYKIDYIHIYKIRKSHYYIQMIFFHICLIDWFIKINFIKNLYKKIKLNHDFPSAREIKTLNARQSKSKAQSMTFSMENLDIFVTVKGQRSRLLLASNRSRPIAYVLVRFSGWGECSEENQRFSGPEGCISSRPRF